MSGSQSTGSGASGSGAAGSGAAGSGAAGSGVAVALAWALVGIPLLWGVAMTLSNALKLFQ